MADAAALATAAHALAFAEFKGDPQSEGWGRLLNGCEYRGALREALPHGQGHMRWPDGTEFEGEFRGGAVGLRGRWRWPDGSEYDGELQAGLRHGQGTLTRTRPQFAQYVGEWRAGRRHGKGALSYDAEGRQRYEGEWKDGMREGRGTMFFASGAVYEGEWVADRKHGQGVMRWPAAGEVYEGEWRDDLPDGEGRYTWAPPQAQQPQRAASAYQTVNRYWGAFSKGQRHGRGTLELADGSVLEGEWAADAKTGLCKLQRETGETVAVALQGDRPASAERREQQQQQQQVVHVHLSIADALADAGVSAGAALEAEALAVDNAVRGVLARLRALYGLLAVTDEPTSTRAARLGALWVVVERLGLLGARLSLADIGRAAFAAAVVRRDDPVGALARRKLQTLHDPRNALVEWQFIEGLARCAIAAGSPSAPPAERVRATLSAALGHQGWARTDEAAVLRSVAARRAALHRVSVAAVVDEFAGQRAPLLERFAAIVAEECESVARTQSGVPDETISARGALRWLAAKNWFANAGWTPASALSVLLGREVAEGSLASHGAADLASELVAPEFGVAVAALVVAEAARRLRAAEPAEPQQPQVEAAPGQPEAEESRRVPLLNLKAVAAAPTEPASQPVASDDAAEAQRVREAAASVWTVLLG
jgi:hypothetical protein